MDVNRIRVLWTVPCWFFVRAEIRISTILLFSVSTPNVSLNVLRDEEPVAVGPIRGARAVHHNVSANSPHAHEPLLDRSDNPVMNV